MGGAFFNMGRGAMGQQPQGMMGQPQGGPPPQQMPPPAQTYGTMPLGQTAAQDPHSAYLQQALQAMLSGKQGNQGNPMGLGSNLLAEALDRYGLANGQRQQAQQAQGAQLASDWSGMQQRNAAFSGGLGGGG